MNSADKNRRKQSIALKQRNTLHDHPLLKKGGKHEKTHKAQRRSNKIQIDKLQGE
jgi:hypothetical protein